MKYRPLFIILFFISCDTHQESVLDLYNKQFIQLLPAEKILETNPVIVEEYNRLFNSIQGIQIPLYKLIKGENYIIYVGKPIGVNNKMLSEKIVAQQDSIESSANTLQNDSYLIKFKKENRFIVAYITNLNDSSSIVLFAVSRNRKDFEIFGNENYLKNRVHVKE